jgi:hypothetical protein
MPESLPEWATSPGPNYVARSASAEDVVWVTHDGRDVLYQYPHAGYIRPASPEPGSGSRALPQKLPWYARPPVPTAAGGFAGGTVATLLLKVFGVI